MTPTFDLADPRTWPVWLREDDICTAGDRVGPFPASRFQWRKLAPPPVKFGSRIACWHRNVVAAICQLPLPDPTPAEQGKGPAAASRAAAPVTNRNRKKRSTRRAVAVA